MKNLITKTTELAIYLIRPYIANALSTESPLVIDATCGNGHDSLALAEMLFSGVRQSETTGGSLEADGSRLGTGDCRLVAIDIQPQAVESTRALLAENGFDEELAEGRIRLICGSHEDVPELLRVNDMGSGNGPGYRAEGKSGTRPEDDSGNALTASVVLFNLGYLPGGDKSLTTIKSVTLPAVQSVLDILAPGGIISIIMYSGHAAGAEEKTALLEYAAGLDAKLFHTAYISMPNQHNAPPEILLITRK